MLGLLMLIFVAHQCTWTEAGNVLIFPFLSRSQLLNADRIATILADDGHNVTMITASNDEPDIKKSDKYNVMFYKTSLSREKEHSMFKEAAKVTPLNMVLGRVPVTVSEILTQRCAGVLFDEEFFDRLVGLKADVAIVHAMMPCIIPQLVRIGVPFLDFCSVPLMHALCGHPHRIPAPPSYVPDGPFQEEPDSFGGRIFNTLVYLAAPKILEIGLLGPVHKIVYRYQEQHGLPYESLAQLRSKASMLLTHGDITFETVRPTLPKVVNIGGIQCDAPKPLEGELKTFLDGSEHYDGLIVFSLGGVLNTEALPDHFLETFLKIFRTMPSYRVVWKLKSVPSELKSLIPDNVKIVDWMPQQDLLGHKKTRLFISHGGIQGSFESICHGVAMLGVNIFGDQAGNIKLLVKKGMALSVDDYRTMKYVDVLEMIQQLLTDKQFYENAQTARALFYDQPLTVAQRLQHAVGYTIRHKGAHHLTSHTALQLHWVQYYSLDVYMFLVVVLLVVSVVGWWVLRSCCRCCISICYRSGKSKTE